MNTIKRLCAIVPLAAALAACDDPAAPRIAAQLDVVSGNQQSAVVGNTVLQPLVVRVVDERGRPVSGELVNFVVASGGGSVFAGAALTNRDGLAQERWTLGPLVGTQTVQARAVDPATGTPLVFATFTAVGITGAASIEVVSGDLQSGMVDTELAQPLVVRVVDGQGRPSPGQLVTFLTSQGGTPTPSQGSTDSNGILQIRWTLGAQPGTQTVEARAGGTDNAPSVGVSFTAQATPGVPSAIDAESGNGQEGTVGTPLAQPLVTRVYDRFNNPVPGVNVVFTTQSGTIQPASVTTDATGRARAVWTLPTAPTGSHEARATVAGVPPTGFGAFARSAATTHLIFEPTTLDAPPNSRVVVRVFRSDAYGNQTGTITTVPTVTSSAPAVASFVSMGGATLVNIQTGTPGDATITFTADGFTGTLPVHVAAP